MPLVVTLADRIPAEARLVGLPVFSDLTVPHGAGAGLDMAWLAERRFEGRVGQTVAQPADDGSTLVAVGVGDRTKVTADTLRKAAAAVVRAGWDVTHLATTLLAAAPPELDPVVAAQAVGEGAVMATYRFTRYKGDPKPCRIESVVVVEGSGSTSGAARGLECGARLAAAVAMARDLVNDPAGAMTPTRLAEVAGEIAESGGLSLRVLDPAAIAESRLGGLQGVAAGSAEPARLIELRYEPEGRKATGSVALVGKGITFDSGGLSLKTADGMETMKTDMSGAAAVLGAMSVLRWLDLDVNVVAIIPATENMPGGRATKPGDVLRIRNGITVEVLNTDAEGRLVLADGLSLAVEDKPDAIIDLATLTGACVVALGTKVAGLMGNNDGWVSQVNDAAQRAGEAVWRLPLPDEYRKLIDSEVADIKNISTGRYGGALTAGLFLREFVGDVAWVHLDIAGPARSDEDDGYIARGGTGFGVRTVVEALTRFHRPGAP